MTAPEPGMELDSVADELYGLAPEEFTGVRTERVRQARALGDRPLAAAIGKLRRPSVAAWLANLLVRRAPDEVAALVELGSALRTAHAALDGVALRALSARRREVVGGLLARAREFGRARGQMPSEAMLRELEESFVTVLGDERAAQALTTGRLSTTLRTGEASHWPEGPVRPIARRRLTQDHRHGADGESGDGEPLEGHPADGAGGPSTVAGDRPDRDRQKRSPRARTAGRAVTGHVGHVGHDDPDGHDDHADRVGHSGHDEHDGRVGHPEHSGHGGVAADRSAAERAQRRARAQRRKAWQDELDRLAAELEGARRQVREAAEAVAARQRDLREAEREERAARHRQRDVEHRVRDVQCQDPEK
jgi:hypothetical protein